MKVNEIIKSVCGETVNYAVFPFGNNTRIEVVQVSSRTATVSTPGLGDISASSTLQLIRGMDLAATIAATLSLGKIPEKVVKYNGPNEIIYFNTRGEIIS